MIKAKFFVLLMLLLFFLCITPNEIQAFQKVDQYLVLKTKKTLFDSPDKSTNTKKLLAPQVIKAKKKYNHWYAIETKYGEKWITDATVITNLKLTKVNKTFILGTNKVAVPIPFFINERISIPKGTVLHVLQEGNGFSEVIYHNKRYWIKNDQTLKPFEQSVNNSNKQLVFHTKKVLFSLPSQHTNTKQQVEIQLIRTKKQYKNWYAIETVNGERWVSDSSVIEYEPDVSDQNNELFLTKQRVGYVAPALLAPSTIIPKESDVKINERWNDWISVDYNGETYYINSPSHETNLVPKNPQSAGELINKELLLAEDQELFTYPSILYGSGTFLDKNIVTATRQWKTWYLINTENGQSWINRDHIIEDFKPITIEETDIIQANEQLYFAPLYDAERMTVDIETEVKVVRKWSNWNEIEYQGKKYWKIDD